jgi:hypothetical protein
VLAAEVTNISYIETHEAAEQETTPIDNVPFFYYD